MDVRVVFIGTPEFAGKVLDALVGEKYNVVAVVSQPDKPVGRKREIVKTPVHARADAYGIPVLQPERLKDGIDDILAYRPDLIVTCAYGQFVPTRLLDAPVYGSLNIHPSLLPKYRGGAPVHRAVWAGDKETGVCLMEMVKAMDAGRVYDRRTVPIDPDDTTETLNLRLEEASAELIREALPKYLRGELAGEVQDEEKVVLARNIAPEEEQVSFTEGDIHEIYNHIRALIDFPVAYGILDGKRVKFYACRIREEEVQEAPGTVLGFRDHAMEIACRGGVLRVLELQAEGKKRMPADAFGNGAGRAWTGRRFD
ncbi:MAG: methionyl-tRNA formyltransferase [Erysipelotrichaceae bacterium]|nr:methionyl-tRNA formyltransferase [Erysipelotrichaceae bacterium]